MTPIWMGSLKRMSNSGGGGGGVRVPHLLTVAFIALKIAGDIDWSWVWVLAPFWIDIVLNVTLETVLEYLIERDRKK